MKGHFYEVAPLLGRARILRRGLESQVCISYRALLEAIETGLSIRTDRLVGLAPVASSDLPLRSSVYATHWRLGKVVSEGDVSLIEPALRELLLNGPCDKPDLRVETYRGDYVDRAADEYLAGPEGARLSRRHRDDGGRPPADLRTISASDLRAHEPILQDAFLRIALLDAGMADELKEYVREVRIVDSDAIGGMSSLRFFGTIFLRRASTDLAGDALDVHWFGGLVHETSHLHLHALMVSDPLVINGQERFDSPLRRDQRPMLGIFHATFVLARLTLLFGRWHEDQPSCGQVTDAMNDARSRLLRGVATIREHGQLTSIGADLLCEMAGVA